MVNNMENRKPVKTIDDYMNDETRVTPAERERINFEVSIIGKMIEAREERGLSQRELAEISGIKQPAIARLESLKVTPQIDTLFKVLYPLGYTLEIVPVKTNHVELELKV
jgi:DNA-binding XRE family transcriptional regulator